MKRITRIILALAVALGLSVPVLAAPAQADTIYGRSITVNCSFGTYAMGAHFRAITATGERVVLDASFSRVSGSLIYTAIFQSWRSNQAMESDRAVYSSGVSSDANTFVSLWPGSGYVVKARVLVYNLAGSLCWGEIPSYP